MKGNAESDAKKWTYDFTCTGNASGEANGTMTITGGALESKHEATDPFISDRGAFFNGRTDFMTIEGMTLADTFYLGMWIRPLGSGTLFS